MTKIATVYRTVQVDDAEKGFFLDQGFNFERINSENDRKAEIWQVWIGSNEYKTILGVGL